jgi:hypothetical protein
LLRSEVEELVTGTIGGDDVSSWTLMHLLDGYVELRERLAAQPEGRPAERPWPDHSVEPGWAYFLLTPAEFEETLRRLRLELVKEGRLNFPVLRTLNDAVDRSLLFPLVDVLEGYDGDPARYAEIELALQCLSRAADDVPDGDRLRAKRAVEHVRDVGADVTENGFSLRYWANNVLSCSFGDDEADRQMEELKAPSEGTAELVEAASRLHDERVAAWTAEVLVFVDASDEDCASHLYIWSRKGDGPGFGRPILPIAGPAANDGDFNPYRSLRSGIWGALVDPADLPELFEDVAKAMWRRARPGTGARQTRQAVLRRVHASRRSAGP